MNLDAKIDGCLALRGPGYSRMERVSSLAEAQRVWCRFRIDSGCGVSELGALHPVRERGTGRLLGTISYNGEVIHA